MINLLPGLAMNSKQFYGKAINTSGLIFGVTTLTLKIFILKKGKSAEVAVVVCSGIDSVVKVWAEENASIQKFKNMII